MAFHRNTTISVVLSAASLGLSAYVYFTAPAFDFRLIASIASLLAFGATMSEFEKYASKYQLLGIFLSMLTLGISLDHRLPAIPFITIAMLLAYGSFKKYFRKWFSESDFLWLDPVLVIASIACYAYGNIHYGCGWKGWALPALPLIVNAVFATKDFIFTSGSLKYMKGKKQNVEVGKNAPNFSLPDKDGNTISLIDYKDKQHVLLIFIRNDWCPSCRIKLRTYEQHRHKFNEKNVQLLTVSPSVKDAVDKDMTTNLGININVIYDEKQEVAKSFGVQLPTDVVGEKYNPRLPLPASFLIDKNGIVRYTSKPDRIGEFLDPTTIFPVLEKLN
ncbi:MAG: redoxin domain-containing protein [Bacteroidetes bacterium]|nr:redoxin domain-containing protein [Bacteroidota bacterium]